MGKLGKIVKACKRTGGFLKRNYGKIGLSVFLSGVIGAAYIGLRKEGKVIKVELDGKIDAMYYHPLFEQNGELGDIGTIDDLVAEVYYLNTGRKIENDFTFTVYDKKRPLKIMIMEILGPKKSGMNAGMGNAYLRKTNILNGLRLISHECGHGSPDSVREQISFWWNNLSYTEPIAEKNVVDSMIALMYIDPDVGYYVYSHYMNTYFSTNEFFNPNGDKWDIARQLNQLRLADKSIEIKKVYDSDEEVRRIVQDKIRGRDKNKLLAEIYKGLLDTFEARFSSKEDFSSKFYKLKLRFKYGATTCLYNKGSISELKQQIAAKEKFLKQKGLSSLIRENVDSSITDYNKKLHEEERIMAMKALKYIRN